MRNACGLTGKNQISGCLKCILICFILFAGSASAQGTLKLTVEKITSGPKHHFFGYIGQSLTTAWNLSGRYMLAIESDFHDHLPGPTDSGRIILIDTKNNYKYDTLDRTYGWNLQQGTMFYWNPDTAETQFFFNDRDKDGKVFTVLYDIAKRKRIREYKFSDTPVGNGGVCPEGGFFYAINYGRMARLRPVTGYDGAYDWTTGVQAPTNDGIFKVNIETGQKELIMSFKTLATLSKETTAHLYINHTLSSRICGRILFYGRGSIGTDYLNVDNNYVMNSDGSGLKLVTHLGGHPDWYDETKMIGRISGNSAQVIYDVVAGKVADSIGKPGTFEDLKGDISLSPNGKMFVNGWETDTYFQFQVYRLTDGAIVKSAQLPRGPYNSKYINVARIDACPSWNRKGNKILIQCWEGTGTSGSRQMQIIKVQGAVVYGCMDSTYQEYDPEATVPVAGDCQTKKNTTVAKFNSGSSLPGISVDVRASTVSVDYPGEYTIRVYDLRGALAFARSCKGRQKYSLPEQSTSGAYFIQIHSADFKVMKKIFAL